MKIAYVAILSLFVSMGNAEELSDSSIREIEHLFSYLDGSGCRFNRNGTWYTSAEASAHLRNKYAYLVKKGALIKTEDFIKKAASQSSLSGKAYHVKCGERAPVSSALWFNSELLAYRSSK